MCLNDSMTLTETDIDQIGTIVKREVKDQLTSFRSEILKAIAGVMKELKAMREEQKVLSYQMKDRTKRIEKLEEIHPEGQHSSLTT